MDKLGCIGTSELQCGRGKQCDGINRNNDWAGEGPPIRYDVVLATVIRRWTIMLETKDIDVNPKIH